MEERTIKSFESVDYGEFKDTEIGRIPKEWGVVELGELFSLEYGKGLTEKERKRKAESILFMVLTA